MDISFDDFPSYIEDSTTVHKMNKAMYMEVKINWTYIMFIFSDIDDSCDLFIDKNFYDFWSLKNAVKFIKKMLKDEIEKEI